jgi:hypothetical protein
MDWPIRGGSHDRALTYRCPAERRDQPQDKGHRHRPGQGRDGQFDGRRDALEDDLEGRLLPVTERAAEVPAHGAGEEPSELDDQWAVEAHLGPEALDVLQRGLWG